MRLDPRLRLRTARRAFVRRLARRRAGRPRQRGCERRGYVTLTFPPVVGRTLKVKLTGSDSNRDAFGNIIEIEVYEPAVRFTVKPLKGSVGTKQFK